MLLLRHRMTRRVFNNGLSKSFKASVATARSIRNASSLVETQLDEEKGVATLYMNSPPVNSLSLEMLQAISTSIQQVEENRKIRSLILTSSVPNLFSAGLDIREMHNPEPERLVSFWRAFQNVYLHLYGSKLACIAAIGGHAPAAGCMLALSCDYRIMASTSSGSSKPFTIGLNESKLGIVAPPWLAQQFIDTVGTREAEKGMCLGLLYTPEQALSIGLVDEVVSSVEEVPSKALEAAITWGQIPPAALYASKMLNRQKHIQHLKNNQQADIDNFCNFVMNDKAQRAIGGYLAKLSEKNSKT